MSDAFSEWRAPPSVSGRQVIDDGNRWDCDRCGDTDYFWDRYNGTLVDLYETMLQLNVYHRTLVAVAKILRDDAASSARALAKIREAQNWKPS